MTKRKAFSEDESSDSAPEHESNLERESPQKRFKQFPNIAEPIDQFQHDKRKQRDAERKRLMRSKGSPNSKNERKKRDAMRKKQARSLESVQAKEARNKKNVANMRLKRSLELTPIKKARNVINAEKKRVKRTLESTPIKNDRRKKVATHNRLKRSLESTPVKSDRRKKVTTHNRLKRSLESTPVKKDRQKKVAKHNRQKRRMESPSQKKRRLQNMADYIRAINGDEHKNLIRTRQKIVKHCFLSYICVSDCILRSKDAVSLVKFDTDNPTFSEDQLEKLELSDMTKSCDGKFYICHTCKRTIKRGGWPRLAEKNVQFQIANLPPHLSTPEMKLNRCEAHLLKLVIPFLRVAHLPRSADFKVIGPMICVQAAVHDTVNDILPIDQELIPVSLKRKLEYKGSYISEVISRSKLESYFKFFKEKNHLFRDTNFGEEQLDNFVTDTLKTVEAQDEAKGRRKEDRTDEEVELESDQNEREASEVLEQNIDDEIPNYLTNIPYDTLIYENLGHREGGDTIAQIVAGAIIQIDKFSQNMNSHDISSEFSRSDHLNDGKETKLEIKVYAPGASGKFVNFDYVEYVEEKCFPHLFPDGKQFDYYYTYT